MLDLKVHVNTRADAGVTVRYNNHYMSSQPAEVQTQIMTEGKNAQRHYTIIYDSFNRV